MDDRILQTLRLIELERAICSLRSYLQTFWDEDDISYSKTNGIVNGIIKTIKDELM